MKLEISIERRHISVLVLILAVIAGINLAAAVDKTRGWHPLSQIEADADFSMGGHKITNLGTPTEDTDAATKGYVDGKGFELPAGAEFIECVINITWEDFTGESEGCKWKLEYDGKTFKCRFRDRSEWNRNKCWERIDDFIHNLTVWKRAGQRSYHPYGCYSGSDSDYWWEALGGNDYRYFGRQQGNTGTERKCIMLKIP